MTIHLILAEHEDNKIKKSTLSAISAAKKINGKCLGLILGSDVSTLVKELSQYTDKVYFVEDQKLKNQSPKIHSKIISDLSKKLNITHIWSAATVSGKDLMPRIAIKLDGSFASEIQEVIDEKTFKRPMYAGDIIATIELTSKIKIITVRASEFSPEKPGKKCIIEKISININSSKINFISLDKTKSERPQLADANIVVSGGRGLKSAKGFKDIIEPLATKLNAAIGASRAVCDAGWAPNDWQVGQTGKIVAPELYIAIGISGAIQHTAGMKNSKIIVAINKDIEAPIFKIANYGIVADAFEVVPELTKSIK